MADMTPIWLQYPRFFRGWHNVVPRSRPEVRRQGLDDMRHRLILLAMPRDGTLTDAPAAEVVVVSLPMKRSELLRRTHSVEERPA